MLQWCLLGLVLVVGLGLPLVWVPYMRCRFSAVHLSLVIAMNLFVAVIPLLILGYAILEAFNPHRSFGTVLVHAFHLTDSTAQTVEDTFSTASSGRNTALSISIISLLITGFDISATVQLAYTRAFGVTPLRGCTSTFAGRPG